MFKNIFNKFSKFDSLCDEYKKVNRELKRLEQRKRELKDDIIKEMNGAEIMEHDGIKAVCKEVITPYFKTSEFKNKYPSLYDEYCQINTSVRLTIY